MMIGTSRTRFSLNKLISDRAGNFGIMTAVLLPVTLGVAGVGMDMANAMRIKSELQAAADSASLAAASALASVNFPIEEAEAVQLAKKFLSSQWPDQSQAEETPGDDGTEAVDAGSAHPDLEDPTTLAVSKVELPGGKSFKVELATAYHMPLNPLAQLLGFKTMKIAVSSTGESSTENGNAISMYLVLDESGSMAWDTTTINPDKPTKPVTYNCGTSRNPKTCTRQDPNYVTKMESLKAASMVLFQVLNDANKDKDKQLIRVGAVSYTHETQKAQAVSWGTTNAEKYVKALPDVPAGGTDSSGAMKVAFDALKESNATEKTQHNNVGNRYYQRFIVLMTDGEMTGYSSNWNSTLDKNTRTVCDNAKKDGIMIFSVAFMAPARGKSLLEYCANPGNYYEPNSMEQLVNDFGEIAQRATKSMTRLTH